VLAQTSLIVQQPSPSADAAGGVQALAAASNALALQIAQWLQQVSTAEAAP
jgi:cholesterol transport system auxiliary component